MGFLSEPGEADWPTVYFAHWDVLLECVYDEAVQRLNVCLCIGDLKAPGEQLYEDGAVAVSVFIHTSCAR